MLRFCLAGLYPLDTTKIAGGAEHMTYMLSQTFAERCDIDFHVLALVKNVDVMDVIEQEGVTIHRVGMPRSSIVPNLLTAGARLAPVFRALKPDVVNSHDCITTDGALRAGCKVVHTIHGIKSKEAAYLKGRDRMAAYLHHAIESRQVSKASAVISVAQYGLDAYAPWIKTPTALIDVPVEDMFSQVPPLAPCKGILFAGAIGRRKNLRAMVKAMPAIVHRHPDAVLYVCGGVSDKRYKADLDDFIAGEGIGEAVGFLGVVDRYRLAELLGQSVSLVLPSYQETMPGVICQAMAAGRVPVVSPVGGVPELVEDGLTGFLVDADDSDTLARRLVELLDDFGKARQMGAAAREVALARCDRHKVADRILEICKSPLILDN